MQERILALESSCQCMGGFAEKFMIIRSVQVKIVQVTECASLGRELTFFRYFRVTLCFHVLANSRAMTTLLLTSEFIQLFPLRACFSQLRF